MAFHSSAAVPLSPLSALGDSVLGDSVLGDSHTELAESGMQLDNIVVTSTSSSRRAADEAMLADDYGDLN